MRAHRRGAIVLALMLALAAAAVWLLQPGRAATHPQATPVSGRAVARPSVAGSPSGARASASGTPSRPVRLRHSQPVAIGVRVLRLVDASRTIRLASGRRVARPLTTVVRYPARGASGALDVPGATPIRGARPLIVFGHGFAVTPAPYSRLLQAWARAGYVVAAPVFPLENARAPGGPQEGDLVNQPADMSFVISALLSATAGRSGPFAAAIDAARVAVAGQSDGGDTALGAAYDPAVRDRRIRAAVVLSGAEDPFSSAFRPSQDGPPLLATQGTADTVNPASLTDAFFRIAPRPKFLLRLLGASHQPPYTESGPQLTTVERVTIAFLDRYLRLQRSALAQMISAGNPANVARLVAEP